MSTKTKAKPTLNQFADPMGPTHVDPDQINCDAGTQTRPGGTNPEYVQTFAEQMAEGRWDWFNYPPCNLFLDKCGSANPDDWVYYPGDGHTRSEAAKTTGAGCTVYAYVREGTARDARRWSLTKANKRQGQGLTKADLRYQAELLLRDPEWSQWSSQAIADEVGLSRPTIETIRQELIATGEIEDGDRIGLDGKVRKAGEIDSDLQIGDWVQGKLITGNAVTEGYVAKIGSKNLKLMRAGKTFGVLAAEAKLLCRLSSDLSDLAPHFGLSRATLAIRILQPDWDSVDLASNTETIAYNDGWSIEYNLSSDQQVNYLGIYHGGFDVTIAQLKINNETPVAKDLAIVMAKAAIDLVISKFDQIPINPVEAGRTQVVNLPVDEAAQMAGSIPEATARPSGEVERELKEVDNTELNRKKPNEYPETADEVTMRLRLLIGQVDTEIAAKLLAEKHGAEAVGQAIAKTLDDACLKEFADGLCDYLAIPRFVKAFEWEFLAGVITDADEGVEPPQAWSWAHHLAEIYRNVGEEGFAKILGGNDLFKDAIALLNPAPKTTKTTKTTGRKKVA